MESFLVGRGRGLISRCGRSHLFIFSYSNREQLDVDASRDMHEGGAQVERGISSLNTLWDTETQPKQGLWHINAHIAERRNPLLKLVWGFAGK